VGLLTFYSHGESRPDPAPQLKALLVNLHGLEDERDEWSAELNKLDRTMKRSAEVSAEQSERKARLEADLARISKRISELDRRATGERAKLLRHAEDSAATAPG
jgi:chromosome segregation ATPase